MSAIPAPQFTIEFQLNDGNFLVNTNDGQRWVRPPYTYSGDGYSTHHNASCLQEQKFVEAYQKGMATGHNIAGGGDFHIEWRVYQYCWAAYHAMHLEGDFVECGVNTGICSIAAMHYTDFVKSNKQFFLFDTFEGMPMDQFSADEIACGIDQVHKDSYTDVWSLVQRNFAPYPNARLVRGRVPESLTTVNIDKVAYVAIDMNAAAPEIAAAEYFWDKLVPGGVMVLDDYGWVHHVNQKIAFDQFAAERGVKVFNMPTGQGMIFKP